MKKEMLINVLQPEECRIAIVEDGVLEELYVERSNQESYVGNIYKGRIVNIEPGIQAAFVDFGIGRNGFLHISDVDPVYYKHLLPKEVVEQMEAEENEEQQPRSSRVRNRDSERRPPRYTEIESAVTLPIQSATPLEDESAAADEEAFGLGLIDSETEPEEQAEYDQAINDIDPNDESEFEESELVPQLPPILPLDKEPTSMVVEHHAEAPIHAHLTSQNVEDEDEDLEFGAGILNDEEIIPAATNIEQSGIINALEIEPPPLPIEAIQPTDSSVVDDELLLTREAEQPEEKPKPKRASRARAKPKAEETLSTEEETKKTTKARKSRKKTDDNDQEKPKPLSGAEHRTTADDEPEIQPFFEPIGHFDIDAPNDRFQASEQVDPPESVDVSDYEAPSVGMATEAVEYVADYLPSEDIETSPPRERFRGPERERGRSRGRNDRQGQGRGERGRGERNERGNGYQQASRMNLRDRDFKRPAIQDIFKRGQEVIVQVIKEAIGTKAPNLSTFISIAGRYLVLMPSLNRVGVSRKIEDVDARKRLREIMNRLNPPKGVGFIVRTAAIDRNESELQNDLAYLLRLWQVVARRIKRMPSPVEIYRESDMITRTIRDNFTADIDTIWVDEANAFAHASEFLQIVMPRYADRIRYFSDTEPIFNKYRVEEEIAKINHKRIDLPQGGSIIIEQTEALVAIDVNSGSFRADNNAEETAYQLNLIAAKEIARQLRLRDLGGVIVNDFIDMRSESHRRKVEDTLRNALKRDRARTKILRISQFGIIEMTRQRIQPSLKKRIFNECSYCKGTGYVKTNETIGIEVMRLIQLAAHRAPLITQMIVKVHTEAAFHMLNRKRKEIAAIEERAKMEVQIHGVTASSPEFMEFECLDSNGNQVRLFGNPPAKAIRGTAPHHERDRKIQRL